MTIEPDVLDDVVIDELPSTEYMRGYLAANPESFDPQMREWLDALIGEVERTRDLLAATPTSGKHRFDNSLNLSPAELRVYRYLRNTIMTQAEIGMAMYVSVNTVKTHAKHIYQKCGIGRRSQLQHFPPL